MQFNIIALIFAAVAAAPAVTQAISYQGFANTVDDGGVCCSLPTGFGFSAQFNNLPAGAQGQGYTGNSCSNFAFTLFGPGTKCQNLGGTRATNLNWFHSPQAGRRAIQASATETGNAAANCTSPDSFNYKVNGVQRTIKVPADVGAAQVIADHYLANDMTALASYEDN
ncbi:hypothetical protein BDN70DRAFT_939300 [Pholiota conissans]|uniref:Uncharacterized protein n=1 Tax=Pholiota conissans TaxID=109636 RepID=A0A9P5YLS9_9AGAR|nr:hypothetical protein BDN70DRAFT_939300 [Pholiota conissans]